MTKQVSKRPYAAPQLQGFGSVRNLTGGSGTVMTDLDGTTTLMSAGL